MCILTFSNTNFTEKTVAFSGIRTWSVGLEGELPDHLTTTSFQLHHTVWSNGKIIFKYFAINNIEHLPNCTKLLQKYFKLLPNTKRILQKLPKNLKILPTWWNLAKSSHTSANDNYLRLNCRLGSSSRGTQTRKSGNSFFSSKCTDESGVGEDRFCKTFPWMFFLLLRQRIDPSASTSTILRSLKQHLCV